MTTIKFTKNVGKSIEHQAPMMQAMAGTALSETLQLCEHGKMHNMHITANPQDLHGRLSLVSTLFLTGFLLIQSSVTHLSASA